MKIIATTAGIPGLGPHASKSAAAFRILVVGINYAPENIGTGKYTSELCEWLAARGHRVRVVAAPPYYPAWKVWPGFRKAWFAHERQRNLGIVRCPLWVPRQPRGLTRLLHLASFAASSAAALVYSLWWRPQLVIAVAPTLAAAPAAWAYARLTGAKCWLHIQDFEVDAAMDMGIVDAGPFKRLALAAERFLLRRFDTVSTISRRMLARLETKGVDPKRHAFLPNWADIDAIHPLQGPSPYRQELGIPDDAVVALYSGNMGLKQGLELLGHAARALSGEASALPPASRGAPTEPSLLPPAGEGARRADEGAVAPSPNLHFVFGGEGPARAALEAACAGLPNVHFLGLQPTQRLNDWLGLADIHLLPQRADVADLVMPSKLTGMLASGRPVLATALPGTGVAEAVKGCGVATAPNDTDAFVSALRTLARDASLRRDLGRAAREQAEATLARDAILLRFERRVAALLGERTASPTESDVRATVRSAVSPHPEPHPTTVRPERRRQAPALQDESIEQQDPA